MYSFNDTDGSIDSKIQYKHPTRNLSSLPDSTPKREVGRNERFLYMRTPAVLSWRLDPDESLSDWTISVASCQELEEKETKYYDRFGDHDKRSGCEPQYDGTITSALSGDKMSSTKIYFVHRAQLAVGPRKSEFFAKVFQRIKLESRNELDCSGSGLSSANCTKIELVPSAASCFPAMLDYMYSGESTPLTISTDTAVALRQLASSFGVRSMFRDTTHFIKKDLTSETATTYLVEAKKFKNLKLQSTAIQIIARNFLSVKITKMVSIPPDLMIQIIKSEKIKIDNGERYSVRIASYCRCREDELTLEIIEAFTSATMVSTIDEGESLYFLHLLYQLQGQSEAFSNIKAMNIYQICMTQVPKVLKNILHTSDPMIMNELNKSAFRKQKNDLELYNSLPAEVKVQLLECSFESSPSSSALSPEMLNSARAASSTLNDRKAKQEMFKLRDEVKLLKTSYDKKVQYYQRMLDAKVQELKKYAHADDVPTEAFTVAPNNVAARQVFSYGMA